MTAGNVLLVADIVSASPKVRAKNNDNSLEDRNDVSFQFFLKDNSDSVSLENRMTKVNKTEVGNTVINSEIKVDDKKMTTDEELEALVSEVKEIYMEELGISEEEFEEILSALGLGIADILIPQNVSAIIAEVKNVEVVDILTNTELTNVLTNLTDSLKTAVDNFVKESGLEPHTLVEMIEKISSEGTGDDVVLPEKAEISETEININIIEDDETVNTGSQKTDADNTDKEKTKEAVTDSNDRSAEKNIAEVYTVKDEVTGKEIKVEMKAAHTDMEVVAKPVDNTAMQDTGSKENGAKGEEKAADLINNLINSVEHSLEGVNKETFSFEGLKVNAADIINQITEAVRIRSSADVTSMEIALNPENLGKVSLNVAAKNGVVTATIAASSENVKAAIENQVVQLKENLASQGLEVAKVEVVIANHGFGMNDDEANQNSQNQKAPKNRKFKDDPELLETDEDLAEQQLMEANGNSVSFTA